MSVHDYLVLMGALLVFWLLKLLFVQHSLERLFCKAGLRSPIFNALLLTLALGSMHSYLGWFTVEGAIHVRRPILLLSALLTWQACTKDIDIQMGRSFWPERIFLALLPVGIYFCPLLLIPFFYLSFQLFGGWSYHAHLPYEILMIFVSVLLSGKTVNALLSLFSASVQTSITPFVVLAFTFFAGGFFVAAVGKIRLGPQWYSWVVENRLSDLTATAYQWGWPKFINRKTHAKFIVFLSSFNRPLQAFGFAFEIAVLGVLFAPWLAVSIATVAVTFHALTFLLTGILFWEWAGLHIALIWLVLSLPDNLVQQSFGLETVFMTLLLTLLFPLRRKLWSPDFLGWWDTPFSQIVYWQVCGVSGKMYHLPYSYLCPFERAYMGHPRGRLSIDALRFVEPLSGTYDREVRDALRASAGQRDEIERIKEHYHSSYHGNISGKGNEWDPIEAQGDLYNIVGFCEALNAGARKHVLPRFLRWLKAPGEYGFNWGEHPNYDRSEPIDELYLLYREEFFDGEKHIVIQNRIVKQIKIGP